mgnify:CR=1 FL=1
MRRSKLNSISNELQEFRIRSDEQIGNPLTSNTKRRKLRNFNYLIAQANNRLANKSEIATDSQLTHIRIEAKSLDLNREIGKTKGKFKTDKAFGLTPKEMEVLNLLPEGFTIRELATKLHLTEATIKSHLYSIYRKLNVTSGKKAVLKAKEFNLLDL